MTDCVTDTTSARGEATPAPRALLTLSSAAVLLNSIYVLVEGSFRSALGQVIIPFFSFCLYGYRKKKKKKGSKVLPMSAANVHAVLLLCSLFCSLFWLGVVHAFM